MRRRDILAGAGLAAGTALAFPAPAIAQGARRLTMVTDWPEGPGLLTSARRLAQAVTEVSGGRLAVEVFPSGALVRPLETFDAVQAGVADMFHSHIGYFARKSPAFHFYSAVPFGFTANELFAWVRFGGGQAPWDDLAGQYNVKPLLCCSTGTQMGGWFRNAVDSVEGFRGLRYRMAGLGAEVFRRLGAAVVMLPAADIVQALRSGAIDACEWGGPWIDTAMGLHRVARYYYYPGWHEPGAAVTLGINKTLWESLEETDRRLIATAAAAEYATSLAEFDANNAAALSRLRAEGGVDLRRFDDAMLQIFAEIGRELVEDAGSGDALASEIYRSYMTFRASIREWSAVADAAFLDSRRLSD